METSGVVKVDVGKAPIDSTKKKKSGGLYMKNVLTRKVNIKFTNVGKNIKELLQKKLVLMLENKCVLEGYIKSNSVRVISYSSGELVSQNVSFMVVFECLVCNPVENQKVKARAINVTKAGIRAEAIVTSGISPIDIFIARDHNYKSKYFSTIKENDEFIVKIIGQRYEINDPVISVLGELVRPRKKKTKPKLILS